MPPEVDATGDEDTPAPRARGLVFGPAWADAPCTQAGDCDRAAAASASVSVLPRCEHMFVTSDGNPYARFRRALETGNEALVTAAALELPRIALDDALRICLVLRGGDPARYERAAVRWLGRFALEGRRVTIDDLRLAADALDILPKRPTDAMERLQRLCVARGVA